MRNFIVIFALFAAVHTSAFAAEFYVLNPFVYQGDAFVAKFDQSPESVTFDGRKFAAFPYQNSWRIAIPVTLSEKTGLNQMTAEFPNGVLMKRYVYVAKRPPRVIVLPPPPKLGMTAEQIVQNLGVTNEGVKKTVDEISDKTFFGTLFGLPLADNSRISSPFGELRKTGNESIYHMGIDFEAKKGSMVAAINDGIIKSAYTDPVYGNSVIIDHGRGIYSLYLHLSQIKVKDGDAVGKGTVVGTVGDTGLASAPHLHFSLKIDGVSVDPLDFVNVFR